MGRPRLYVVLGSTKLRVTAEQKHFVDEQREQRHISTDQVIRDMIQHCMDCPFYLPSGPTNGTIPPIEKA